MAVRTAELLNAVWNSSSAPVSTSVTVPGGRTWIIKDIRIHCTSSGGPFLSVWVQRASPRKVFLFRRVLTNTDVVGMSGMFVVLEQGDVLGADLTTSPDGGGDAVGVWISGTHLQGVAP